MGKDGGTQARSASDVFESDHGNDTDLESLVGTLIGQLRTEEGRAKFEELSAADVAAAGVDHEEQYSGDPVKGAPIEYMMKSVISDGNKGAKSMMDSLASDLVSLSASLNKKHEGEWRDA